MHDMIERLLDLKDFCQKYESTDYKVHLSEEDWELLETIKEVLLPAKIATKRLQLEQLNAGF
jgi:hypothetical protein